MAKCIRCKGQANPGRSRCEACRIYNRDWMRNHRPEYIPKSTSGPMLAKHAVTAMIKALEQFLVNA